MQTSYFSTYGKRSDFKQDTVMPFTDMLIYELTKTFSEINEKEKRNRIRHMRKRKVVKRY